MPSLDRGLKNLEWEWTSIILVRRLVQFGLYGLSIIELVKENPKEKTIHCGGIKGQTICQRYMDMTYNMMDKDGNVKMLPLFADIDVRTPKYTFRLVILTVFYL